MLQAERSSRNVARGLCRECISGVAVEVEFDFEPPWKQRRFRRGGCGGSAVVVVVVVGVGVGVVLVYGDNDGLSD